MDKSFFKIISKAHIFRGMSPDRIETFIKTSNYKLKKYVKGNTIAFRGDLYLEFMVLIQGTVIGEMVDPNGNAIEVEVIKAPRPLAPAILFGKNNKLQTSKSRTNLCFII